MNRTPDLRCFTTEPHIDFADLSCMQDACHMTVCGSVVECRSAESGIRNPESGIRNLESEVRFLRGTQNFFFPTPVARRKKPFFILEKQQQGHI